MATINPTVPTDDPLGPITWAAVTETDTAAVAAYKGGLAAVEVTGTFDSATVQMQYGSVSGTYANIDTDEHPDGTKFTTAGVTLINLPRGFIIPSISGGGATQSLNIKIIPVSRRQ